MSPARAEGEKRGAADPDELADHQARGHAQVSVLPAASASTPPPKFTPALASANSGTTTNAL